MVKESSWKKKYNWAKHRHFQWLYWSCSAGKTRKLGHSQVRVHVIIWIYSSCWKKNRFVQHNLYLNRYKDKLHCGWETVVLVFFVCIFLLCSETKAKPEEKSCKYYSCIIFLTSPTFPNHFSSRWATCSLSVTWENIKRRPAAAAAAAHRPLLFSPSVRAPWGPVM